MLNAMANSTIPQIPDFPDVTQALPDHSTAALLHASSARDNIDDDIWTDSHPPPLVAPFTAPTVPERPPAAPDPVTGVTPPKTATLQLGQPPDGAVQIIPATVTLPDTHAPYDCHHSEMLLSSHPLDGAGDNTDGDNKELEKCTLDLLLEPPLIHTLPGYNGSSMTAIPRDWAHLKSTLGLHVELPANPNSSAGNLIMLLQGDPLPALGNMHPLACIDDKPLPPPGVLTILKSLMGYHYGNLHSSPFSFPVPNVLLP